MIASNRDATVAVICGSRLRFFLPSPFGLLEVRVVEVATFYVCIDRAAAQPSNIVDVDLVPATVIY